MKVKLEKLKHFSELEGAIPWVSCAPFVENSRAFLVHRPKHVTLIKGSMEGSSPYLRVKCWCGASISEKSKLRFVDLLSEEKLVCLRCEENAISEGGSSSEELLGHQVTIGGVKAMPKTYSFILGKKSANLDKLKYIG